MTDITYTLMNDGSEAARDMKAFFDEHELSYRTIPTSSPTAILVKGEGFSYKERHFSELRQLIEKNYLTPQN